jgi:hypothetical protein
MSFTFVSFNFSSFVYKTGNLKVEIVRRCASNVKLNKYVSNLVPPHVYLEPFRQEIPLKPSYKAPGGRKFRNLQ